MSRTRSSDRRPSKRGSAQRGIQRKARTPCDRPRIDPRLKRVFKEIGTPAPKDFRPDPFQLEALELVRDQDVLVSAPTGAGKTWIAVEAIRRLLNDGMRVWYASPLKALSNSLYREFKDTFGPDSCGILTGDRKENPSAPILVGTTEILRNQLYDAMYRGADMDADLVILDEAHYLSDPDRGVVWEETLIYMPSRVRLLLLSATIPNAEEVAAWLEKNRGVPARVVRVEERPVPLEMLFLLPDGLICPLGGRRGLSGPVRKAMEARKKEQTGPHARTLFPAYGDVIRLLRRLDLLPAIFFLKSRADCDRALLACHRSGASMEARERIQAEVSSFFSRHPHLKGHRHTRSLTEGLVGAHHAGQLPAWKLLVETMMQRGLLEAIFSTSTVAAGVNFPARTVVLVQSDRFDGREFRDLSARDFHQMVGRAGRRGKDRIGFAVLLPGSHLDPGLILSLVHASPEPLESRIQVNFSMVLNLLLSHHPEEARALLEQSFASFQRGTLDPEARDRWERLVQDMALELSGGLCDIGDPFEVLDTIERRDELRKTLRERKRDRRKRDDRKALQIYLERGRLFLHQKGGVHLLFGHHMEDDKVICEALDLERPLRTKGGKIRLRRVRPRRIQLLFDRVLDLPPDPSARSVSRLVEELDLDALDVLELESRSAEGEGKATDIPESLPCEACPRFKDCHTPKNRRLRRMLSEARAFGSRLEGTSEGLWFSFKRHLRFLKETGFVDNRDRLTEDGVWASRLRLDHPLLIAEAIRKGAFDGATPDLLAGIMAPFVWDRSVDVIVQADESGDLEPLEGRWSQVVDAIERIRVKKTIKGFENPPILFWPAVALFLWAGGATWDRLLVAVPVDDGDMVSLILRTADHLRQVSGLQETHPQVASRAEEAIEAILRPPAYF